MKTVQMFEKTIEDDGTKVRIVDVSDSAPTYTAMVRFVNDDAWRLVCVNEPMVIPHAIDSQEGLDAAANAAVSFARDEQERADKLLKIPGRPHSVVTWCGVVMLAFPWIGDSDSARIVYTNLPSLVTTCQEVGSCDTGSGINFDLGPDGPDQGIWLGIVRETYCPGYETVDGMTEPEVSYSMVSWGEPLWHYAVNDEGEQVSIARRP